MNRFLAAAVSLAALAGSYAFAQLGSQAACRGTVVAGTVRDSTQALIPGAEAQSSTERRERHQRVGWAVPIRLRS